MKKIGHWGWALSGEEGMTALVVSRALRENIPVAADLMSRYTAMLEKQKKLLGRADRKPRVATSPFDGAVGR